MAVDLIDDTTGIFIDSGGDRTPLMSVLFAIWACKAGNASEE